MLIVAKLGGDIIREPSRELLDDLRSVGRENKIILVHGGGDEVTEIADRLGKPQRFIVSPGGIRSRYTDEETVIIYTMVMCGKNNKELVAKLQQEKIPAIGLSGVDGGTIRAERKKRLIVVEEGRKRVVDGGFTGEIKSVNSGLLNLILENNYVPVVAPVALGEEYEFLNVDSDRAAAHVAGGVHASRIIFLTDVQGVILEHGLVREIRLDQADAILRRVGFGMEKKLLACTEAVRMGVKKAIIASGTVDMPVATALAEKNCTVITR